MDNGHGGIGQEEWDARTSDGEDPYALVMEDWRRQGKIVIVGEGGATVTVTLGRPFTSQVEETTTRRMQPVANLLVSMLRRRSG